MDWKCCWSICYFLFCIPESCNCRGSILLWGQCYSLIPTHGNILPVWLCSYVIVVEHDLSVLDYLSDFICCLYGKPGAYGVVTLPFSVREGINIFLAGFVPTENLRFRDESLTFKVCHFSLIVYFYVLICDLLHWKVSFTSESRGCLSFLHYTSWLEYLGWNMFDTSDCQWQISISIPAI